MPPLLDVQDLTVVFDGARQVTAVDRVNLHIASGETLGVVGESGSGKSVTAFSILRLVQPPGRIVGGRVMFEGRDLLRLSEQDMREVRGARISLIFQEPMTALNPVMRVGDQIAEALWSCSTPCESPIRHAASAIIHTSCPAGCASAS
jgi:ABC-type dipeptide/oligopeptide/nickel transport system ATPase component